MNNMTIPVWEKVTLTVNEAMAYSGIGEGKIRELLNEKGCPFALCIGNRKLVKRVEFERYISENYAI